VEELVIGPPKISLATMWSIPPPTILIVSQLLDSSVSTELPHACSSVAVAFLQLQSLAFITEWNGIPVSVPSDAVALDAFAPSIGIRGMSPSFLW
jgi:hypothetical protein